MQRKIKYHCYGSSTPLILYGDASLIPLSLCCYSFVPCSLVTRQQHHGDSGETGDRSSLLPAIGLSLHTLCVVAALYSTTQSIIGNNALVTVLRQEIDRFNHLLHVVHSTLTALTSAIKGEIIMSEALEEAYSALFKQGIPAQWKVSSNRSYELQRCVCLAIIFIVRKSEMASTP